MTPPILITVEAHRCVECSWTIPAGHYAALEERGYVHVTCLPEGDS